MVRNSRQRGFSYFYFELQPAVLRTLHTEIASDSGQKPYVGPLDQSQVVRIQANKSLFHCTISLAHEYSTTTVKMIGFISF